MRPAPLPTCSRKNLTNSSLDTQVSITGNEVDVAESAGF